MPKAFAVLIVALLVSQPALAQDAGPAAAAPVVVEAPVVAVPTGPVQLLASTPLLDGTASAGEWKTVAFYPLQEPERFQLGASWDSDNLYLLIQGPAMAGARLYVDAAGDGWLNGRDNLEVRVTGDRGEFTAEAFVYDSSIQASPERALAPAPVAVKAVGKTAQDGTTIEVAIPRSEAVGLQPAFGKSMKVAAGVYPSAEAETLYPADPLTEQYIVQMVDQAAQVIPGLAMSMKVKDRVVTPGQTLSVELFIDNETETPLAYKNFTIGGEQRIEEQINFLRVRGDTLKPKGSIKWGFLTDLPESMALGAHNLVSRVNLADGRTAVLTSSFEVVEAFEATFDPGSGPISPIVERKMTVRVKNNKNRPLRGTVTLTMPAAIEDGLSRKSIKFEALAESTSQPIVFRYRPEEAVAAGEYDLIAEVEADGAKKKLSGKILVGVTSQPDNQ